MKFYDLAVNFNKIVLESSRLKITELLSDIFTLADAQEARLISYLSLGTLRAPFEGNQFNFAQKNIEKVLAKLFSKELKEIIDLIKQKGDIGLAIVDLNWPFIDLGLSVIEVYKQLLLIESITGVGAQEEKSNILINLLKQLDVLSASFVVRIIVGTMRLGFSDMTLIDSLSWMLAGNKSFRKKIENSYNISADIGFIVEQLKLEGINGLDHIHPTLGVPIMPAAAERAVSADEIIEKIGPCIAQPKLDGFRLQIHIDNSHEGIKIWFYSRNLQNMSYMFPDLFEALRRVNVKNLIMEGEAIVFDEETNTFLPFQETVKRKRKHDIDEVSQSLPLQLFIFDILYLDDQILLDISHVERRKILTSVFSNFCNDRIKVIEEKLCQNSSELNNYFIEKISLGLEGLVVKRPDAIYQPGKRNFNWIKLKRQMAGHLADTIDTVILGYYFGSGKRVNFGIGAFLVGIYNKNLDKYETIAKIGTGLTDLEWKDLKHRCDTIKVTEKPNNVVCANELFPDVWVDPKIVVITMADEISQSPLHSAGKDEQHLGLALRFPRFMGYSLDKLPEQATSIDELKELYNMQFQQKKS